MGRGGPSCMDGIGGPPCGQGVGGSGVGKGPVGSLWVSVGSLRGPNVSQCIPVGPSGSPWGLCGSQCLSMGSVLVPTGLCGSQRFSMGLCGSQCLSMGSVCVPMLLCGPLGPVWLCLHAARPAGCCPHTQQGWDSVPTPGLSVLHSPPGGSAGALPCRSNHSNAPKKGVFPPKTPPKIPPRPTA